MLDLHGLECNYSLRRPCKMYAVLTCQNVVSFTKTQEIMLVVSAWSLPTSMMCTVTKHWRVCMVKHHLPPTRNAWMGGDSNVVQLWYMTSTTTYGALSLCRRVACPSCNHAQVRNPTPRPTTLTYRIIVLISPYLARKQNKGQELWHSLESLWKVRIEDRDSPGLHTLGVNIWSPHELRLTRCPWWCLLSGDM